MFGPPVALGEAALVLASAGLPPGLAVGSLTLSWPTAGSLTSSGLAVGSLPPTGLAAGSLTAAGVVEDLVHFVETSRGPLSLVVVFVYSFLIAFALPGPSEVVLGVAEAPLLLGFPYWVRLVLIMVVSGVGKAFGSVVAFHLGQEAKQSGYVERKLRESRFDVLEWSEKQTVQLSKKYGYAGLAMALSVPFFPDTISIYAFAVLEEDYTKFAIATFVGSVGRLVVTVALFAGGFALL